MMKNNKKRKTLIVLQFKIKIFKLVVLIRVPVSVIPSPSQCTYRAAAVGRTLVAEHPSTPQQLPAECCEQEISTLDRRS